MRNDQVEDMLGGPVIFGPKHVTEGRRRFGFWRVREPSRWCAACSRAYPNGAHRVVAGTARCPYADCDADLAANAHPWSLVHDVRPNYPAAPSMSVQYVLPPLSRAYRHTGLAAKHVDPG